jgi:uncharacterized protein YndB with AHSA1/START domain
MEVRPGGQWRFVQHDDKGQIFAFHGVYHETKAPERLVYTFEWEGMPGHTLLEIDTFLEENGKTTNIWHDIFETVEDRDGMLQQGMEDGINQITERVTELLEKVRQGTLQLSAQAKHSDGGSLKLTRVLNAPREKVWKYWFDTNDYMCWYGPKDYTACEARIDMRVGGKFLNCMEGPDGKKVWGTGIYKEILEPNRFVATDSFADEHGNVVPASYYGMGSDLPLEMEVEVTLEDLGDRTRMTLEHCGLMDGVIIEQTRQGWNESFDKLEKCLE